MAVLPVTDTTESRYADISRLMAESGQWLVPEFEPGVPFWGKPPLFAWLTAGAMKLFGSVELLFRLPHFLLSLAVLWLTARTLGRRITADRSALAMLVLASCPLFFVSMGTVMTEAGLLFSTTLSMTGFWLAVNEGSRRWGWLFFAGLGLGMLAKGPVGPALTLLPVLLWLLVERDWRALRNLPWLGGSLLCLAVFLPWYVAAEKATPGFLHYFLLGEHVLRFIQPGWEGDLYGNPHHEAKGMIWLFWFQATAAWGLLTAWYLLRRKGRQILLFGENRRWTRYLMCWLFAPLLFFTFSGNILWTYVITGLPALALLVSEAITGTEGKDHVTRGRGRAVIAAALLVPVASLLFAALAPRGHFLLLSEKALVSHYQSSAGEAEPLFYLDYLPTSARFYASGKTGMIGKGATVQPGVVLWLAVHRTDGQQPFWNCKLEYSPRSGVFDLYRCIP